MMKITSNLVDDQLDVDMPAILDTPASRDLRQLILKSVKTGQTVKLNCAKISQITTPGAQTMIAIGDFVGRQSARFVIVSPSDALVEAFADLGLFSQLMAWEAE